MPSGLKKLDHVMDKLEENIVGIATLLMVWIQSIRNVSFTTTISLSIRWVKQGVTVHQVDVK